MQESRQIPDSSITCLWK